MNEYSVCSVTEGRERKRMPEDLAGHPQSRSDEFKLHRLAGPEHGVANNCR